MIYDVYTKQIISDKSALHGSSPFNIGTYTKVDKNTLVLSFKKSLKLPKGDWESVHRRRTDNTMTKRKSTKGQTTIYKTYT